MMSKMDLYMSHAEDAIREMRKNREEAKEVKFEIPNDDYGKAIQEYVDNLIKSRREKILVDLGMKNEIDSDSISKQIEWLRYEMNCDFMYIERVKSNITNRLNMMSTNITSVNNTLRDVCVIENLVYKYQNLLLSYLNDEVDGIKENQYEKGD